MDDRIKDLGDSWRGTIWSSLYYLASDHRTKEQLYRDNPTYRGYLERSNKKNQDRWMSALFLVRAGAVPTYRALSDAERRMLTAQQQTPEQAKANEWIVQYANRNEQYQRALANGWRPMGPGPSSAVSR